HGGERVWIQRPDPSAESVRWIHRALRTTSWDGKVTTVSAATSVKPKRVVVVGAGMVGLSVAWFLQEHEVDVTVVERRHVAAGASWGNAGWLTPGLTVPLPEPAVLRFGLRAMLQPDSPLYVPLRPDPRLWAFLIGFARHSTRARWEAG